MAAASGGGFAFTVNTLDPDNVTFALGGAPNAAAANASWVSRNKTAGGPDIIDRAMAVPSSRELTWPVQPHGSLCLCGSCTLNATGQSRVTLSRW